MPPAAARLAVGRCLPTCLISSCCLWVPLGLYLFSGEPKYPQLEWRSQIQHFRISTSQAPDTWRPTLGARNPSARRRLNRGTAGKCFELPGEKLIIKSSDTR